MNTLQWYLHGFSLSHEFSEGLLGYGGVNAFRFLELGPQIEVWLGLVVGDGIGIILLCCEYVRRIQTV